MDERFDGSDPISYLRMLLHHPNHQMTQMIRDRDAVYREYGRLFHPANLAGLSAEDFKGFLLYDSNRHWWGIHRHQAKVVADMDRLRRALGRLLDEQLPIAARLDWIEPTSGRKPVPGLGKAVFTPILHVVYPEKYAVWNSIAESAMRRLGFWPEFPRGASFGEKYVLMNDANTSVAELLDIDRWTVDTLWWRVEVEAEPTKHQYDGSTTLGAGGASSSANTRQAKAPATFLCDRCSLRKASHLESQERPGVCIDCSE